MTGILTANSVLRLSLMGATALLVSSCASTKPVAATVTPIIEAPRIALVLGGGGTKGFAHVGVIQALEENGITPSLVVGTSVGSLVGSLYASGMSADKLEQLALTTADSELLDFTLSNQGFIEGIKLKNFINAKVNNRPIESFPIRFAAIAAEKSTLKKIVLTQGNAGLAVQASCSVPNIFIAPRIPEKTGKKYIDGGVVSLVPVDSARDLGADIIIAVDVTATKSQSVTSNNKRSSVSTLSDFWGLLEYNSIANNVSPAKTSERERADIIITPDIAHISSLDSSQRRVLIAAGRQATTAQIDEIKKLIAAKSKSKYAAL